MRTTNPSRWVASPARQLTVAALMLFAWALPSARAQGVCAEVKLELSQDLVLTRTAFVATLTVNNGTSSLLNQFATGLDIRDVNGGDAAHLFSAPAPELIGIASVDGGGFVVPNQSATIRWTILPLDAAAVGGAPTPYTIGGWVTSSLDGVPQAIDLFPAPIQVFPEASLRLDYYLQTTVYGDNPFTPDVLEPSEPFSLGVIVRNLGQGAAKNLTITQQQPKYLQNPQNLALAVKVVAAEQCGLPLSPNLTVAAGDLSPGEVKVFRWLLESNLQGSLTDLSVSWTHKKGTGETGLSLIDSVEIHRSVHLFDAASIVGAPVTLDNCPDFLVDDPSVVAPIDPLLGVPAKDYPDEIHFSDGTVQPVFEPTAWQLDGLPSSDDLAVALDVTVPAAGWYFLRIEEPGNGNYALAQATRVAGVGPRGSLVVGGPGDVSPVWTSSRPIDIDGDLEPDLTRHQLHLVDYFAGAGTYRYELTYEALPVPFLSSDLDVISVSSGGIQKLFLDAGPERANQFYLVLGSLSGTTPGIPVDYVVLPLNPDPYLFILAGTPNLQTALNTFGVLDSNGRANAQIIIPSGLTTQIGALAHHAYIVFSPSIGVYFASNPVPLYLVP